MNKFKRLSYSDCNALIIECLRLELSDILLLDKMKGYLSGFEEQHKFSAKKENDECYRWYNLPSNWKIYHIRFKTEKKKPKSWEYYYSLHLVMIDEVCNFASISDAHMQVGYPYFDFCAKNIPSDKWELDLLNV